MNEGKKVANEGSGQIPGIIQPPHQPECLNVLLAHEVAGAMDVEEVREIVLHGATNRSIHTISSVDDCAFQTEDQ
jgi:hypothetical protein